MNTYIRRLLLTACLAGSTLPVHAGWASDIGSYVSQVVSGWFSQPSDRTTAYMAALGAAAVGLSAYLIYTLWKKQNGPLRPQNPDPRPDNPQPPVIVVEPVEPAPEPMPIIETGNAVVMPVARVGRIASLTPAEQHEIQRGHVPRPVAYQSRIGQPVPKESRAVVSCPGPQPYLSWYDLQNQGKKPQVPVVASQDNPGLQAETKRSAAVQDLTASQEWTHISADEVLPDSSIDLVEQEKDLIERGREVAHQICSGEKSELTEDEMRSVLWYIWPKNKSELTFKIEDTPDRLLYKAFLNCKNKNGELVRYERGSSHFPAQVEGGVHYGIDIDGLLPLPEKTTILFAPLTTPDELHGILGGNTLFYVKPEDHGCKNPLTVLWEKGVLESVSAAVSMVSHGYQFGQSTLGSWLNPSYHDWEGYAKERTPHKLAQAWLSCLDDVECDHNTLEKYKEFAHLKKGGVFKMRHQIGALCAKRGAEESLSQKQKDFVQAFIEEYPGEQLKHAHMRNGHEIFIPLAHLRKAVKVPIQRSQPMLVDLEAGIESESPRALRGLTPHVSPRLALDHKDTN